MAASFEIFWAAMNVRTKIEELGHKLNIMGPSSSTASSARSDDPMVRRDLESNAGNIDPKKGQFIRAWRVPLSVRRGYVASDLFKNLALVMTLLCIAEFLWIQRIRAGLVRVANDPYDIRFSNNIDRASPEIWDDVRQSFIRDAIPVPVHSHNDYWRRIPLFEALGSGCISIEADVHLKNEELYVAHKTIDMHTGKKSTLKDMYLAPLERLLRERNGDSTVGEDWRGIYNQAPKQTLVLLVDHKTDGPGTLDALHRELQPLRDLDFLTFWNGTDRVMRPLTIVATGTAPFTSILSLSHGHRDIFFDAPLDLLHSMNDDYSSNPPHYTYNASNSYLASAQWHRAKLWHWRDPALPEPETPWEKDLEASQLEQAAARGLVTRYWDTPSGPPNLVDIVWRVSVERKVGLVNMDDLGAVRARARGWGRIEL